MTSTADTTSRPSTGQDRPSSPSRRPAPKKRKPRFERADPLRAATILDLIVAARPGGQHRPQQQQMVREVDVALERGESLLVQAGTGCGKSLGYLAGASARPGRTVISTVTKQLSEQLTHTDLPILNQALKSGGAPELSYALLKGRANYLCKAKVADLTTLDTQDPDKDNNEASTGTLFEVDTTAQADKPGQRARPSEADQKALRGVLDWANDTTTGDRSEGPAVPERVWGQVSTDSSWCPGASACPFGQECFAEKARKKARSADVVITNHALLALDLESESPTFGSWDRLVVDEAHEFVDSLTKAWALEIDPERIRTKTAQGLRRVPVNNKPVSRADLKEKVEKSLDGLAVHLERVGRGRFTQWDPELRDAAQLVRTDVRALTEALDKVVTAGTGLTPKALIEAKTAFDVLYEVTITIDAVLAASNDEYAVHVEESHRGGHTLRADPLDPGSRFQEALAGRPVIATSATLAMGSQFDLIAAQFGLGSEQKWRGVDVGTPFDYRKQGILYVAKPTVVPEPVGKERAKHADAVRDVLTQLVAAAGGRTLALFSTTQNAVRAGEHLREHLPGVRVLVHGEAPPGQLVKEFHEDERSVLCATMGLWSGVDVPGPSLSLVTMDAFPFPPPDDPLLSARKEKADKSGKNGWYQVYLLATVLKLKQGAGRAHRTVTDKAVVALLDPRALTKRYGKVVLESLPPMWFTTDLGDTVTALERLTDGPHPDVHTKTGTKGKPAAVQRQPRSAGSTGTPGSTSKGKTRRAAPSAARTRNIARTPTRATHEGGAAQ